MRGLGKVLAGFMIVTAGTLLYVHERVEMLRISYRIYKKSSALSEKSEEFRRLKFEVAELRSPEALERRLGEWSISLTLPKEIRVLKVAAPLNQPAIRALSIPRPTGHFFDFVGQWIQVAQARTDQ